MSIKRCVIEAVGFRFRGSFGSSHLVMPNASGCLKLLSASLVLCRVYDDTEFFAKLLHSHETFTES